MNKKRRIENGKWKKKKKKWAWKKYYYWIFDRNRIEDVNSKHRKP